MDDVSHMGPRLWITATRKVVGPSNFWTFEWLIAQFQAAGMIPLEPRADPEPYRPGDGMDAFRAKREATD